MTSASSQPVLCVGLTPAWQRLLRFSVLRPGEVNRTLSVTACAAGKAVNVARVLRTFDVPVRLTGFLGGETGRLIRNELTGLGIDDRSAQTRAATRICQTLINEETGEVTELVEEAAPPAASEWDDFMRGYEEALAGVALVVLAGTLMAGALDTVYHELAVRARDADVPLLIDSHNQPLLNALRAKPWLVKLNAEELGRTLRDPSSPTGDLREHIRRVHDAGARSVLVTRGAQSAWLFHDDVFHEFQPPAITAVNPIGSGDAMTAGIVVAHRRGQALTEAVRFGIACGAANALTERPGHVNPQDVERLLPLVRSSS
jgi:tagatose 6-phosphate kinase